MGTSPTASIHRRANHVAVFGMGQRKELARASRREQHGGTVRHQPLQSLGVRAGREISRRVKIGDGKGQQSGRHGLLQFLGAHGTRQGMPRGDRVSKRRPLMTSRWPLDHLAPRKQEHEVGEVFSAGIFPPNWSRATCSPHNSCSRRPKRWNLPASATCSWDQYRVGGHHISPSARSSAATPRQN